LPVKNEKESRTGERKILILSSWRKRTP